MKPFWSRSELEKFIVENLLNLRMAFSVMGADGNERMPLLVVLQENSVWSQIQQILAPHGLENMAMLDIEIMPYGMDIEREYNDLIQQVYTSNELTPSVAELEALWNK